MKKINPRAERIAEQIHRDLMKILSGEIKDPRISWVTVNAVELTKDYSVAKVYYSVLDKTKQEEVAKALESAGGFIRKQLAQGLTTYTVPRIKFIWDESIIRGARILGLINQVNEEIEKNEAE